MTRKAYKRTPAQRKRMADAQRKYWADKKRGELNGSTVGIADALKAVTLARSLVELIGRDGARQMVDTI